MCAVELNAIEASFFKVLGRMCKRLSDGSDFFYGSRVGLAELQEPVGAVVVDLDI